MTTTETNLCALDTCRALILAEPGRPVRNYCSAAHRAMARQVRQRQAAEPAETLPTETFEVADTAPVPPPARLVAAAAVPRRPVPTRTRPPLAPRVAAPEQDPVRDRSSRRLLDGRSVAVLCAAAVVIGSAAWITVDQRDDAAVSAPVAAPAPAPDPVQWVTGAAVTLASVDRQLGDVAQAENAWSRLPQERRDTMPDVVRRLLDRKATLEAARTVLQAQLDAWQSVGQVATEVADVQRGLDALDQVLATNADPGFRSQAEGQRELTAQQLDGRRRELDALRDGIRAAAAVPLPDVTDTTTPIVRSVLALTREPPPAPPPAPPGGTQPAALSARTGDGGKPRHVAAISGPPDPRGPRDEPARDPGGSSHEAGSSDEARSSDEVPPQQARPRTRSGPPAVVAPVTAVVSTVSDVVAPPRRESGNGDRVSKSRQGTIDRVLGTAADVPVVATGDGGSAPGRRAPLRVIEKILTPAVVADLVDRFTDNADHDAGRDDAEAPDTDRAQPRKSDRRVEQPNPSRTAPRAAELPRDVRRVHLPRTDTTVDKSISATRQQTTTVDGVTTTRRTRTADGVTTTRETRTIETSRTSRSD